MVMKARFLLIALLLSAAVLINGCSTAKGIATGVGSTTVGITTGVAQDVKGFWHGLAKADEWLRRNLW